MSKRLVGVAELAEILGTNKRHVYALVETGKLPTIRVGQLLRFDPEKVIEHLARPARAGAA